MRLLLENIGKVAAADIEINGITVVAGDNNTGKSTLGKTLFAVFNSFYALDYYMKREKADGVFRALDLMFSDTPNWEGINNLTDSLLKTAEKYTSIDLLETEILSHIDEFVSTVDSFVLNRDNLQRIFDVLTIDENELIKTIISKNLDSEFNGQINNMYSDSPSKIVLEIKTEDVTIEIEDNRVTQMNNHFDLKTSAIYIDDPFVLDDAPRFMMIDREKYSSHRAHLRSKLIRDAKTSAVDEIIVNNKLKSIFAVIDSVCPGNVTKSRFQLTYAQDGSDKKMSVKNLSTGMKAFVIIKMLLENGSIEHNGTIILDEPEVHLHPEWQLLFAEIIVLLQKEFGMHILLNTHSPYFLNALEVYSKKHKIDDKCNYYLSSISKDNFAYFENVTDNLEKIYSKLAAPLQQLENEMYIND